MEQQESWPAERDRRFSDSGPDYWAAITNAPLAIRGTRYLVIAFAVVAALAAGSAIAAEEKRVDLSTHAARAQAAIKSNNAKVAIEELQALLRTDPRNVNALASLGMVEFTQSDYSMAARQFKAALALSPSLWNAQAFLGMCELRLGNVIEGRKLLEASFPHLNDKLLKTQSGLSLIESYTASAESSKGLPILQVLQNSDPTNTDVLYLSYRVNSELAAASLRELNTVAPDSVRVHQVLAQSFMAQEQYNAAVDEYRRAIERSPRLPGLHYELGQAILAAAFTAENRESAAKEFLAELDINSRDAEANFKLGEIAYSNNNLKEAKEFFRCALKLRPSFGEAEIGLGKALADEGDEANAIEHLEVGIKLKPTDRTAHYRLARLYRGKGRMGDSERELAIVKKLSGDEKANPLQ